jgi:hypothetical protein
MRESMLMDGPTVCEQTDRLDGVNTGVSEFCEAHKGNIFGDNFIDEVLIMPTK